MQEVTKINSKKEIFDIKMTLKLIKMNENAIDKSLLNNDLEFLDDNGKILFKTDFEIFEESLEKIL